MKRFGNLFEQVIRFDALLWAAKKARSGCGWSPETAEFFFFLEPNLLRLQEELESGSYQPGGYRFFTVTDPKTRTIAVAPFRDRVVHQAIVRVLTGIYEPVFISDSYATRENKGTHAAILRAQTFVRDWTWYVKMDVSKYFDSIDHDILLSLVRRKVKDRKLLDLIEKIVRNPSIGARGLPVGNLTSQFFANVYLDLFDHQVKDRWRLPGYVRYMDDWVLFGEEREDLVRLRSDVAAFLEERLHLRLKDKATWLHRSRDGLSFLGVRIYRHFIRIKGANRRRGLRRIRQALKAWEAGDISEDRLERSLSGIVTHLRHFQPKVKIRV